MPTVDEQAAREDPEGFIRRNWERFRTLDREILDLQHRAARVAAAAGQSGDLERQEQAKEVIRALGRLKQVHDRALNQILGIADFLGIETAGMGAVPVVAPALVTGLALVVLWAFRSYAAQERKLELIEQGTLTPEQAAALDPGGPPAQAAAVIKEVGGLVKWLAFGLLAWAVVDMLDFDLPWSRNPPLVVYGNPPGGMIGSDVEAIYYRHSADGRRYVHDFEESGVQMIGLPDGSVLLEHPEKPLWSDF